MLAAVFISLAATGCANLKSAPAETGEVSEAVAIPLESVQSTAVNESSQLSPDASGIQTEDQALPKAEPTLAAEAEELQPARPVPQALDIEIEAHFAELELKRQQQAEAEVGRGVGGADWAEKRG